MTDIQDRIRDWWDADAEHYDRSAGHTLSDPVEAAAWRAVLLEMLPEAPARVLDAGAGTGAMSLLAAELGHRVTSLDLSTAMLAKAETKAKERGVELAIVVGSVNEPPAGPFDVVVERHVIWTAEWSTRVWCRRLPSARSADAVRATRAARARGASPPTRRPGAA